MTSKDSGGRSGEGVELDPETAKLIKSIHERLDGMDLFTLLDVDLNASAENVRRAYFKRSRLFHPDRYYTRDLGPYKKMLERIFAFVTASYDFLKDDRRRAAYRKKILTDRDRSAGDLGGVVAVETSKGLVFKITDEQSFFAAAEERAGAAESAEGQARNVVLPQKRYALPKLRRPGAAATAPPAAEKQEDKPASDPQSGLELILGDDD